MRKLNAWLFYLAVTVALYFRFFRFPFIPINPALGDQGLFLLAATRIADGKIIYKDFIEISTPGADYLYFVLIKLFGQTAALPVVVTLTCGVGFAAIGLRISQSLITDWRRFLAPLLYLSGIFVVEPDTTHHVFSILLTLLALAVTLEGIETPAWGSDLGAGALCGAASFFTTQRGLIALFGLIFLKWIFPGNTKETSGRLSGTVRLAAGFVGMFGLLIAPTIYVSGAKSLVAEAIRFATGKYRDNPWNSWQGFGVDIPLMTIGFRSSSSLMPFLGIREMTTWLGIYIGVPTLYAVSALRLFLSNDEIDARMKEKLAAILVMGIVLLLSIAYAPTQFRIGLVCMPALILITWWLKPTQTLHRWIGFALMAFAITTLAGGILRPQFGDVLQAQTATGRIATLGPAVALTIEKYNWLKSHTAPGEFIYAQPAEYYYLFKLRNPSPVSFLSVYDYTRPQDVAKTIQALELYKVRYVIWLQEFHAPDGNLQPLADVLHDQYRMVHKFQDEDEVWERKK